MPVIAGLVNTLSPGTKRSLRRTLRRPLIAASLSFLTEAFLTIRSPISRLRFRSLARKKNLKLNLGSGRDVRPGWVNIDMGLAPWSAVNGASNADAVVIKHDLRRGLPLPDESCESIYSSHFFEHLEYADGIRLLRDCHRVLVSDGTLRLALPNFKRSMSAYLEGDVEYFSLVDLFEACPDVEAGTESIVDYLNYGVYQNGEHKCIYDEEKLRLVLSQIGFKFVESSYYKEDIDPSDPIRRRYSFYVEAMK